MDATIVDGLASLELRPAEQPAYDRPFELRLLYEDPVSGAEHYLSGAERDPRVRIPLAQIPKAVRFRGRAPATPGGTTATRLPQA